jgi:hypothetical protein
LKKRKKAGRLASAQIKSSPATIPVESRKAVQIAKAAPRLMNLEPTMVGGSDALDVNMTTRKPIKSSWRTRGGGARRSLSFLTLRHSSAYFLTRRMAS